jgi:hypothetical protein
MRKLYISAILTLLLAIGCAAAPDPNEKEWPMSDFLINNQVNVELINVNGLSIPDSSLQNSMKMVQSHIAGPINIGPTTSVSLTVSSDGIVTEDQLYNQILRSRKLSGISAVTIVVLPKLPLYDRGFSTPLEDGSHLVVLYATGIEEVANIFVNRERAYELVLTHEMGHTLGVPHRLSHKWSQNHCTNPDCLMYPKPDLSSVLTAIITFQIHDDYCQTCKDEIKEVRK